jgi:hypothetical protein
MSGALPLAVAAGIYPLGLAIVVRYLGDPPSLRHAFAYLGGAATVTLGAGAVIVTVLRVAALPERQERTLGAGMQMFLGVVLLVLALWLRRSRETAILRSSRRGTPSSRETDRPARPPGAQGPAIRPSAVQAPARPPAVQGPPVGGFAAVRTVFFVGLATYLPSAFYVAALRDVAKADLGSAGTVFSLFACAVLVLFMVELPIIVRLLMPRQTGQIIATYNAWIGRHGRDIVVLIAAVCGAYFLVSGVATLVISD